MFFNGKVVIGPRIDVFILSFAFLVLMGIDVIITVTIPVILNQSQSQSLIDLILAWIVNVLLLFSVIFMLLTGLTNPGIIPKNDTGTTGFPVPRYLLLNGVCIRQKFCRTCKIYRPPRSNHCSVCDNCILRHDHHCVALGTCVGLGNYRWFLLLSGSLALLCPCVFWLVKNLILSLETQAETLTQFVRSNFMLFYIALVSFTSSFAFILLFVYHFFITAHNLTTNEHLKKYYKINPFDYGRGTNFRHVLCFPQELFPIPETPDIEASYRELASTNSECISDFYDY